MFCYLCDPSHRFIKKFLNNCVKYIIFGFKVVIKGALRNTDALYNIADGRVAEAFLIEQPFSRFYYFDPSLFRILAYSSHLFSPLLNCID
ncbi:hypothetical protein SDC9_140996 [bioreactor metagenome]|uniref:Uncharacterized protein n=1 Tax=bioreactor metagenome TaxID=1076179 RepID=A0A645DWF1_9ZZZZ